MAFHHRKLLDDSSDEPLIQFCESYYCYTIKNPSGTCPPKCTSFCSSTCKTPPLEIPPPPDFFDSKDSPAKSYKLSIFLTTSLAVLTTAIFVFACYAIYKCYSKRYNSRPEVEDLVPDDQFLDEDHGPVVDHHVWYIRTVGLQESAIKSIAIVKYKKGDGLIEGTECSVCLSEFQEDESLRLLPKCDHAFHVPCIDTWLRSHTNCPMCRAGIVKIGEALQSQEASVENLGPGDLESERENDASEARIGIEDEGESRVRAPARVGLKMDEYLGEEEGNSDSRGSDGIQPMRRSVSMDSLSASTLIDAIANAFPTQFDRNFDNQLDELKESNDGIVAKRVGINQSLSRGPSSMKRSFSCSAKVLLSRSTSRARNSVIRR